MDLHIHNSYHMPFDRLPLNLLLKVIGHLDAREMRSLRLGTYGMNGALCIRIITDVHHRVAMMSPAQLVDMCRMHLSHLPHLSESVLAAMVGTREYDEWCMAIVLGETENRWGAIVAESTPPPSPPPAPPGRVDVLTCAIDGLNDGVLTVAEARRMVCAVVDDEQDREAAEALACLDDDPAHAHMMIVVLGDMLTAT